MSPQAAEAWGIGAAIVVLVLCVALWFIESTEDRG